MNRNTLLMAALVLAAFTSCGGKDQHNPLIIQPGDKPGTEEGGQTEKIAEVGKEIPAWVKGELDIHFINTTTGESAFVIFPDGTQMLIDAAGSRVATGPVSGTIANTGIRSRWDPTAKGLFLCGDYISRYIRKCQAWTGNEKIDYVLLTHFHNDHFGGADGLPASDKSSSYTKQSLPLVLDNFKVGKLMDRGWPDYNYPFDMLKASTNAFNCANYVKAVKWHVANSGMKAERFVAGSDSQISMVRDAASYPSFKVRNLAVNGEIWTGKGNEIVKTFPELKDIKVADPKNPVSADNCPQENHTSAVVKISYGAFDYFGGGDLQFNGMSSFAWKDVESAVAKVCGPVDVMKADHHGSQSTNGYTSKSFAMKYLQPKCWIVNSWTDEHPRAATFEGVTGYLTDADVFITNSCSTMAAYKDYSKRVKGENGHIVVRVVDGGAKYYVLTLSDSDEKMTVRQIAGPYTSR